MHTNVIMPPYGVYRNFLDLASHAQLLAWAIGNEVKFKPTVVDHGVSNPFIRRSLSVGNFEPMEFVFRQGIRKMVQVFIRDLRVSPFEPSELQLELVAHNDGAFYTRHIDTFVANHRQNTDRLLSGVYYFHSEPKAFSGGALRLYPLFDDGNEDNFIDIQPEQNTLVVFPSWAPHEVLQINCPSKRFSNSRFAVNCWLTQD